MFGHHVVVVRLRLLEQSLLYQIDVLRISRVVPIIDQASPHSVRFPPVIGFSEDINEPASVCAMEIGNLATMLEAFLTDAVAAGTRYAAFLCFEVQTRAGCIK